MLHCIVVDIRANISLNISDYKSSVTALYPSIYVTSRSKNKVKRLIGIDAR